MRVILITKTSFKKALTLGLANANITDVMRKNEEELSTRKRLLLAGREEFSKYGYRQASLRRICAACGVTTGAFYFFFKNKDALFCEIVDPVIEKGQRLSEELCRRELEEPSTARDNDRQMMEFELLYRTEILLLLDGAEGSSRERFKEQFLENLTRCFSDHFAAYIGREPNPEIMRLLVDMRVQGNMALLKGDYDMERTLFLNDVLACYADGGFQNLIENLKDRL